MLTTPEELMDYMHGYLNVRKDTIGLKYVGYGEEEILPEFPAALVTSEPLTREVAGTHIFGLVLNCSLFVLHSNLNASHQVRTREDMQLATRVRNLFHTNLTLEGNVIFGFFDSESPGLVRRPNMAMIATRMSYRAEVRETF